MAVKQVNVFLENQAGRLYEVTRALSDAKIDIRAFYVADTSDFGILRMIVDKPTEAEKILKNLGLTVSQTEVIAASTKDYPGALNSVLKVISDNSISLQYMYAFVGREAVDTVVILRVDDDKKMISSLEEAGIKILDSKEVYGN